MESKQTYYHIYGFNRFSFRSTVLALVAQWLERFSEVQTIFFLNFSLFGRLFESICATHLRVHGNCKRHNKSYSNHNASQRCLIKTIKSKAWENVYLKFSNDNHIHNRKWQPHCQREEKWTKKLPPAFY